ncbi:hypothetical protein B9Y74_05560 [Stenotrophomonas maltophilia]|uniref:hypothetical protein n=1 Tax=Stenotrophomonas maltophilia TaxID=40324 RepID=UPI000C262752|nr:hypothetical protein [Stenotrophomonas maltophilia]PJL51463.1 hypothetical protein B9Y74_05560 [Stenotrophomonas maltophilia]
MTLHTPTDIARNAQRIHDAQLPDDNESAYQDAVNEVATHHETAELVAVIAGSESALDYLISRVDVPSYLRYDLRALLNKQRDIKRQIEAEMKSPTYHDARFA